MEEYITMPSLDNISKQGTEWISESMPSFDFSDFSAKIGAGQISFEPDKILNSFLKIFFNEVYVVVRILALIIAIMMISAILDNLKTNFIKTDKYNSGIICVIMIIGMSIEIFQNSSRAAIILTEDITNVMWSVVPIMMTLVSGSGFTTAGIFTHPVLLFMCNVFSEMFNSILMPISVIYLVISLIDMMCETIELGKFRELLKKTYNFILGFVMTLFTALLTVSSFAGASLDSVGAKGVKFAVSNMVPFVGRSLSDAMGAVVSASVMLKNSVGITSIVCITLLCVVPILKNAVIVLCVRISAAVCEPVCERKTVDVLSCVADSISMINAALIATVIMMIISLAIIIGVK